MNNKFHITDEADFAHITKLIEMTSVEVDLLELGLWSTSLPHSYNLELIAIRFLKLQILLRQHSLYFLALKFVSLFFNTVKVLLHTKESFQDRRLHKNLDHTFLCGLLGARNRTLLLAITMSSSDSGRFLCESSPPERQDSSASQNVFGFVDTSVLRPLSFEFTDFPID